MDLFVGIFLHSFDFNNYKGNEKILWYDMIW
jgi:hypothetical protein